jgi:GT2 family glycosyltransferase
MRFCTTEGGINLKRLGAVIPTYFAGKLLSRAIESVQASAKKAGVLIEIIVVDCHPKSRDRKYVTSGIQYFTLPKNPGFGSAANLGFKKLLINPEVDEILLLNPDAFLDLDFFSNLLKINSELTHIQNPKSPLILFSNSNLVQLEVNEQKRELVEIASRYFKDENVLLFDSSGQKIPHHSESINDLEGYFIVTSQNSSCFLAVGSEYWSKAEFIQNAGSYYYWPDIAGDIGFGSLRTQKYTKQSSNVAAWCGAAVVLSRTYLEITKGFDERFFLYYEDTELSIRGSNLGYPPFFTPDLVVYHNHSFSTGKNQKKRSQAIWRSRALFSSLVVGRGTTLTLIVSRFLIGLTRTPVTKLPSSLAKHLLPEVTLGLRGVIRSLWRKMAGR